MATMVATINIKLEAETREQLEQALREGHAALVQRLEVTAGGLPNGVKAGSVKVTVTEKKIA